jgi:Dna[CI] antecedent, DciA
MSQFHGQIICYDRIVIKANQVMPAVVADVIRKAPLSNEKVAFAWRLAVGPAVDKATKVRLADDGTLYVSAAPAWLDGVRQSVGLIRSRLAHFLGEDAVKRISYEDA